MSESREVSRRSFIVTAATAGTGLLLGVRVASARRAPPNERSGPFQPNVWIAIDAQGTVTIQSHKSEMGQGVWTALPMIVAEELDADWSKVRVERAPMKSGFGSFGTGGSGSVSESYEPLRKAGAAARMMLIAAAAQEWDVPANECTTDNGFVVHQQSNRRLGYGALATSAGKMPVPNEGSIRLKDPKTFRIVGKPMKRLDSRLKVDGTAKFGIDVRVPGMLIASVARCPVFGGTLGHLDDARAKAIPGVRSIIPLEANQATHLPARVAVVAETTWAAMQARKALQIEWNPGPNATFSSTSYAAECRDCLTKDGIVALNEGNVGDASRNAKIVEAVYEVPLLAHATMEPMNCTAHVRSDGADIWVSTQFPSESQRAVARLTGLKPETIAVHVMFLGGGFGRRANMDFVTEAADLSKRVGAPVKVIWSREEDIQHDFYRPSSTQRLRAAVDAQGKLAAWDVRLVGPSTQAFLDPNTKEPQAQEAPGAEPRAYGVPNMRVEFVHASSPAPLGWWRAVGNTQNIFAMEAFFDEVATAAGKDPVALRLELLASKPRMRHVIEVAAKESGWGTPLPKGKGRGIAFNDYGGTHVAEVAEVTVSPNGKVSVDRVVCAIDCGQIINPDIIRQQAEGSVAWALGAVLHGQITLEQGRVKQSNFHDYQVLRMREMPRVDVHLVENHETPTGIGEPAVPPLAPAVVNAIYAATGKRVRSLPVQQG